jgi:hypothetical protein
MGRLRVFKDYHTVRAPRAEVGDRPAPSLGRLGLPAASCRQLSPMLSLRCLGLEKLVQGSFMRYTVEFPT